MEAKLNIYFILGADRTAGHHEADHDENQLLTGVNIYTSLVQRLIFYSFL